MIHMRKRVPYRKNRTPELIRRLRRIRRVRNILFLIIWPLFLLDEEINRGYQEQGTIRAITSNVFFKLLLIAGLFVAIMLTPGLDFLSSIPPVLVLVFLLLVAFGTQIYASGRAAITSATLIALVLAWCMATTFPLD